MGLIKKEILVKETSVMTLEDIILNATKVVNSFQNSGTNKKQDGSFIDYFFVDVLDSRNKNLYRVYSSACEIMYGLQKQDNGYIYYTLIDNENTNNNTDAGTLPGGDGDNGNPSGDVEDGVYEDDYPIELEYTHFSKSDIPWSFESFERPVLVESEFATKTVTELQEIYGAEYEENNIAYYINVGKNSYENNRYLPIYKTDAVEFVNIPIGVPGGEKIDTNSLFTLSASVSSPEVKVNNISQYKLTYGTNNGVTISGLNLLRTILFGPDVYKHRCLIKINGKFLCNYITSEEKPTRTRKLVQVISNKAASYTTAAFNNVGVIAYASSYTSALIADLFSMSVLYGLHGTAKAAGGKMGVYLTTTVFVPEQVFNVEQPNKLKVKFYKFNSSVTDCINVDVIKNEVLPYLNTNLPKWKDEFAINDSENINYVSLNGELVNMYIKSKCGLNVLTNTNNILLADIETKEVYIALVDIADANKIIVYGKYSLPISSFYTDNGFKVVPVLKYTGTTLTAYLRDDTEFTLLDTPITIINQARDILV